MLASPRWFVNDNDTLSRAGEAVICSDFCRKPSSLLMRGVKTKDKARGYSRAHRTVTAMRVLNESADSVDNVPLSTSSEMYVFSW